MVSPSRSSTSRGRRDKAGKLFVGGLVLLGLVASVFLVFSNSLQFVRIGLVAALWAAAIGALAATKFRKEASVDKAKVRDLQTVYELQLEREVTARREYELGVEARVRHEVGADAAEMAALRAELTVLRQNLQRLFDGDLPMDRPALHADATRIQELESGRGESANNSSGNAEAMWGPHLPNPSTHSMTPAFSMTPVFVPDHPEPPQFASPFDEPVTAETSVVTDRDEGDTAGRKTDARSARTSDKKSDFGNRSAFGNGADFRGRDFGSGAESGSRADFGGGAESGGRAASRDGADFESDEIGDYEADRAIAKRLRGAYGTDSDGYDTVDDYISDRYDISRITGVDRGGDRANGGDRGAHRDRADADDRRDHAARGDLGHSGDLGHNNRRDGENGSRADREAVDTEPGSEYDTDSLRPPAGWADAFTESETEAVAPESEPRPEQQPEAEQRKSESQTEPESRTDSEPQSEPLPVPPRLPPLDGTSVPTRTPLPRPTTVPASPQVGTAGSRRRRRDDDDSESGGGSRKLSVAEIMANLQSESGRG
ncbi:DUF6779 domain-containing protein [Nocardia bovistercoris]|uniref:DUF6779 domain-containing protein n=1 Tax=Nocardia bovistercoris TaxID=2785916 RepID=UPI001E4C1F38|nr:DUF6779 domain-containing protein [Nocardia bovistercoris]